MDRSTRLSTASAKVAERINSHAKEQFGLDHPLVRNGRSVRNLNTLTYIVINLKALQRARSINSALLAPIPFRN